MKTVAVPRVSKKSLTPRSFIVLACLADGKPWSGYDISKYLRQRLPFIYHVPANSQIYAELSLLEQLGYVTADLVLQARHPGKYVSTITQEGRTILARWADQPTELQSSTVPFLLPFALKSLDMQEATMRLARYARQASRLVATLAVAPEEEDLGALFVREHARTMAQAEYAWATKMVASLIDADKDKGDM